MRCKRCGCTESRPCLTEVNGEAVPCSWVMEGLCTACLTTDEQLIVATLMEHLPFERELSRLETREQAQRALFTRVLPAFVERGVDEAGTPMSHAEMADQAMQLAAIAALKLYPEPARIVPATAAMLDRMSDR